MGGAKLLARLDEARLLELQLRFARTPAPTFHEGERAILAMELWRAAGLAPWQDEAGNVLALRGDPGDAPVVCVAAHLDTVFPAGQALEFACPGEACPHCGETVPGGEHHGPGIADCAAGLAAITHLAEVLGEVQGASPLLFAATGGEEGAGDLKGSRALFEGAWGRRIGAFVTVDTGARAYVVHRATASRRFRVTFSGPGGHAWAEFGTYNPIHAAGDAIARIAALGVPREPQTTFNVGTIAGGRSVNAIAESATFELDLRSEDGSVLDDLVERAQVAIAAAHGQAKTRAHGGGSVAIDQIGDRPGGATPAEHPLVQAAVAALEAEGFEPRLGMGSTDANIPISLGIPAIAFPWGGSTRGAHSTRESFRVRGRLETVRALARLVLGYDA